MCKANAPKNLLPCHFPFIRPLTCFVFHIWSSNETSSGENIPDMQSHVTPEVKDQLLSIRWNKTFIADILRALKGSALLLQPCP